MVPPLSLARETCASPVCPPLIEGGPVRRTCAPGSAACARFTTAIANTADATINFMVPSSCGPSSRSSQGGRAWLQAPHFSGVPGSAGCFVARASACPFREAAQVRSPLALSSPWPRSDVPLCLGPIMKGIRRHGRRNRRKIHPVHPVDQEPPIPDPANTSRAATAKNIRSMLQRGNMRRDERDRVLA